MKKVHTLIVLSILMVCSLFAKGKKSTKADAARLNEVIVYTYDSFCGEWGSGPEIAKRFEAKTGMKVTFIDCGDGVQILSKAQLEKKAKATKSSEEANEASTESPDNQNKGE
jgi:thiamine transport system substrate-binding protein